MSAFGEGVGYADVNGVRLEYAQLGEGPDLVWAHGLSGNLEDGRLASDALADRGYRVTWYSSRGHGRSTPVTTAEQCGYQHFADDLAALLDHLGIDRPLLAGGSHGSNTVLRHEALHPGRARALLLVAPGGNSLAKPGGWKWAGLRSALWWASRKGPEGVRAMAVGKTPDPYLLAAFDTHDLASVAFAMRHIPAQAAIDPALLSRFDVPTHVCAWDEDPIIHPIAVARAIAAAIPGATFEEIPKGIEMKPEETATLVADLVDRWARSQVATS